MARLQVRTGIFGLQSPVLIGMLTESRLRLRKCCGYLNSTADRFERAERLIKYDERQL